MIRASGARAGRVWEDPDVNRGLPAQATARRAMGACAAALLALLVTGLGLASSSAAAPDAKRVVGGDEADAGHWPYVAALTYRGDQYCGATVITPGAVLTAAHCVADGGKQHIRVITGRPDLDDTGMGQSIGVDRVFIHPRFGRVGDHDLAVLLLRDETTATPATLPTPEQDAADTERGDPLRVAGWGATKPGGGGASATLRETAQHPIDPRRCRRVFHRFKNKTQICTHGDKIGAGTFTSSCYGDSGGPLIADDPPDDLVVGVVSYGGRRCGEPRPTVYARVASGLAFIKDSAGIP
jgi:secreted trypsin-like serine protease